MTFGPNWFNRREQMEPGHLELVFGGRANWEPADGKSPTAGRWRTWLATYRDALRRAGLRYQLQSRSFPTQASRSTWSSGPGTRRGSR